MIQDLLSPGALVVIAAILAGVTFHEAAHAYAAKLLGDPTAADLGRVTLNPFKHIDPIGTIALPAILYLTHAPFLFGYAKPVPVRIQQLRHQRRSMALVAAAGPAANLAIGALLFLAAIAFAPYATWETRWLPGALHSGATTNLWLGLFNLIPIPPLDGSKILAGLMPGKVAETLQAPTSDDKRDVA